MASVLLFLAAGQAAGATSAPAAPSSASSSGGDYHVVLTRAADYGPLPYEYRNGHIVFQAELNGERVWMMLDTGSTHNVIDAKLAARLKLPIVTGKGVWRLIGNQTAPARRVDDVALVIPHAIVGRLPMAAVDLPAIGDPPVSGVIGHDITGAYTVVVNKRASQLTIARGTVSFHGDLRPVPLIEAHGRDQVRAIANGIPLTLTIDTGQSWDLDLSPAAWARVAPVDAQVATRAGMGMAGQVGTERASRLPALSLGDVVSRDLEVRIGPQALDDVDGRIGMGLLSRYSFALDAPHGQLWLIPTPTDTSALPPPVKTPAR